MEYADYSILFLLTFRCAKKKKKINLMPRTVSSFLSDSPLVRLSQTKDSVQEESLISASSVNSDSWKLRERKRETINAVKTRDFKKGHVILITITWKAVPI